MTFNFMHFGNSTCEQKVHSHLHPRVNAKQSKVNDQDNIKDDEKEDDDNTNEDNDEDNDDDNEDGDDEEDNINIDNMKCLEKDEEEEENECLKDHKTSTWITTHKDKEGSTTISRIEVEEEMSEFESEETIFKHGIVKRPKNPYFVTRLRMKRRNQLHIPSDVLRDYDIKLPSKVMLLDQEGRRIYVKVVTWKDGRTWLTRGWKSFVKINNLSDEDRCICEFVINNCDEPSTVYINMIVLPAGSWLSK
ncbi:B3 domain-containing protein At5g60140-like [Impatiens glandulifera]|uniref:B3 domain-containing protein At5g60140-like n=1 Tax=Impatiens glandulifera TaxID=253017 RepID=UPI001FB08D75|nr:B3 domain-containing protein At5g60140-like [Impatiens glandulifera]